MWQYFVEPPDHTKFTCSPRFFWVGALMHFDGVRNDLAGHIAQLGRIPPDFIVNILAVGAGQHLIASVGDVQRISAEFRKSFHKFGQICGQGIRLYHLRDFYRDALIAGIVIHQANTPSPYIVMRRRYYARFVTHMASE